MTNKKPRHIDLRIRISDDGGPLFALLDSIDDSTSRNDRLRTLAYLGLVMEASHLSARFRGQGKEAANAARFGATGLPPSLVCGGGE